MKMRKVTNLFLSLFAAMTLLMSNAVFAEATLPEIYQTVQAGQLTKADTMIKEVLQNHPNSAKAHYVAAEINAKQGKLDAARSHLLKAESLAPGLPFAQAGSVQKLQTQLASPAGLPSVGATSIFSSPLFWGLIAILVVGTIMVLKRRKRDAVQVYNAPAAGYPGTPGGPAPYPGAPGGPSAPGAPGGPGYPGAPAAGSGLMGSLATGAALGAGMYAGQALAGHLMGGRDNNFGNSNTANPNLTQVGGSPLGDQNFGVREGSWDDSGASGWDDSGGGDFMNDV